MTGAAPGVLDFLLQSGLRPQLAGCLRFRQVKAKGEDFLKQTRQEYERPHPSEGSRLRSLIWSIVSLFFGWTIFFYWWSIVLKETTSGAFIDVIAGLMFVLAVLFIVSIFWIAHNLRLARRGRRSSSTPYFPGSRGRDKFDRSPVIENLETLRTWPVVVVDTDEEGKSYVRGDEEREA
ncbi:MAG: hypothetical protein KY459_02910 [Acidobacteria bacterium]|nr:hypothetical protein [Acidobacteriota bacterium]